MLLRESVSVTWETATYDPSRAILKHLKDALVLPAICILEI